MLEDLNLAWEVRDGIRAHSWKIDPPPSTQEAFCVRYADRIAYLTHDALDAIRAGVLAEDDFPAAVRARFGATRRGLDRRHDRGRGRALAARSARCAWTTRRWR